MKKIAVALLVIGCGTDPTGPDPSERLPSDAPLRLELTYAVARSGGEIELGGLDGALDAGARVELLGDEGALLGEATADPDGRFSIRARGLASDRVRARIPGGDSWSFTVRDPAVAVKEAVRLIEGSAGSIPNDLVFLSVDRALLVRSGDDAISVIEPSRGLEGAIGGVRFPQGALPWFATAIDAEGKKAAVTAIGDGKVYLLDLERGSIEATLDPPEVTLDEPFVLSRSIDLDGDGAEEDRITRFRARSPQAIAVRGDRLFVAYSGFVDAGAGDRPPVYVPAVIADSSILDGRLLEVRVLGDMNAQEIRVVGGELLIVCTGVLDQRAGVPRAITPGAISIRDLDREGELRRFDLGTFAPASAVVAAGGVWLSSLAKGEVMRIDLSTEARETIALNDEAVDSVFRLALLPGGLIAAPSFNTDRLHLIDVHTRALDPAPFFAPLELGPGRPIFDGLQIIARRPGRAGVDFTGPDLLAVSGVASRLRAIDLRRVLGP
jgi:hypothetical protein